MAFDCLEVAVQAAESIGPLIERIERRNRDLADQIQRAAACMASNIDEANGNRKGRRIEHFHIALGSAREVTTQLRIARAWGYVDDVDAPLALLDRVRAMLWRLTR